MHKEGVKKGGKKVCRNILLIINTIRRSIIKTLLGNELLILIIKTDSAYEVELIDEKCRLNFGRWKVQQLSEKFFKLNR